MIRFCNNVWQSTKNFSEIGIAKYINGKYKCYKSSSKGDQSKRAKL